MALVLAVVVSPGDGVAQGPGLALGGGWFAPGGDDFDDTDAGLGLDVGLRGARFGPVDFGVGLHWSTHGVAFSRSEYDVLGVYVEPRMEAAPRGRIVPFAGARVAWMRKSIRVEGLNRSATGSGAGVLAGVRVPVGGALSVEGAAGATLLRFGELTSDGTTLDGTDSSGRALFVRLGVVVKR